MAGLDDDMVGHFVRIIRALDTAYLAHLAGEHDRASSRDERHEQQDKERKKRAKA